MLMPKKNRVAIFEHLFKEGVMVAKKDHFAPKHQVDIQTRNFLEPVLIHIWHPLHEYKYCDHRKSNYRWCIYDSFGRPALRVPQSNRS